MSIVEVKIDKKTAWVSLGKGKCAELWVNGKKKFPVEKKKVPAISIEEFERYKCEVEAVILLKNRKIMEWENQPVVLKSVYYNTLKGKNKRIKKLLQIIKSKQAVEEKDE